LSLSRAKRVVLGSNVLPYSLGTYVGLANIGSAYVKLVPVIELTLSLYRSAERKRLAEINPAL